MGIFDTKRALGQGGPPAKEVKKDTSILRESSSIDADSFMHRLREPKYFKGTDLTEEDRVKIGKELSKSWGGSINKEKLQRAKDQLKLGKWGEYRGFSPKKRQQTEKLLKRILE